MLNASEYRRRARVALDGSIFSTSWLYMLLAVLLTTIITSASSVIPVVGSLLVIGPLTVGLSSYSLHVSRNTVKKNQIGCIFEDGIFNNLGDNIILGLLITVFTALWTMLFVIPGIVKAYSYAMAPYIKCDNPGMGANDCITESRRMMNGHKWQLFCLDFSFIGWWFVGSLCCGIGTLWVSAYMRAARTEFYEQIKGSASFVGTASPDMSAGAANANTNTNTDNNNDIYF